MAQVVLSPVLDIAAAAALKQDLVGAFSSGGDAVVIDAGQVQRVGALCLQLLVAAARRGASVANASPAFIETATLLGLGDALRLEELHV